MKVTVSPGAGQCRRARSGGTRHERWGTGTGCRDTWKYNTMTVGSIIDRY